MIKKKKKTGSKDAVKKRKRTKTVAKKERPNKSLINFKVSRPDRRELTTLAKRYAKGNLSQWLRIAGMLFKPTKTQRLSL